MRGKMMVTRRALRSILGTGRSFFGKVSFIGSRDIPVARAKVWSMEKRGHIVSPPLGGRRASRPPECALLRPFWYTVLHPPIRFTGCPHTVLYSPSRWTECRTSGRYPPSRPTEKWVQVKSASFFPNSPSPASNSHLFGQLPSQPIPISIKCKAGLDESKTPFNPPSHHRRRALPPPARYHLGERPDIDAPGRRRIARASRVVSINDDGSVNEETAPVNPQPAP